jgi:hypothetical protein
MQEQTAKEPWFPLEVRLKSDESGQERDALIERLDREASALKRRLDSGVPPAEFESIRRVREACLAGVQVVQMIWRLHHPEKT